MIKLPVLTEKKFHICITILFQFKFWKYWFQGQMRRKLANFPGVATPARPSKCICNRSKLLATAVTVWALIFWWKNFKITLYFLFGEPRFCLMFNLSKNKGFESEALLKKCLIHFLPWRNLVNNKNTKNASFK